MAEELFALRGALGVDFGFNYLAAPLFTILRKFPK
jgi:hypothetical protein